MNLYLNVSGGGGRGSGSGGAFTVLATLDFIDSCLVSSNGMQKRTEICSQNRM